VIILGGVLSVVSALSFSINNAMARRGMSTAKASQGGFVTVMAGVPLFLITALIFGQLFRAGELSLWSHVLLAGAGIVHFGIGRNFNYQAMAAIGTARSQPIQAWSIPYSILIAYLFLGEEVDWISAAGVVLVILGTMAVIERRKPAPQPVPEPVGVSRNEDVPAAGGPAAPEFQLRPVEGYTYAALATICYGTSPVLIRTALEGRPDLSIYGGTIATFAAGVYVAGRLLRRKARDDLKNFDRASLKLFVGAGFFVFLAQLLRFLALSLAPVAVTTTLQRLSGLFSLILAATINKSLERVNKRVVLGVIISLVGSVVLILG
jgi:drug/metabolite transporter (DMT)-like permease